MIKATSRIATITFDGRLITITRARSGFVDKGTRSIPVDTITAVTIKAAGLFTGGYIRFVMPGSPEHRGHRTGAFQTDVLKDENAVPFGKAQQPEFEALKEAIEKVIAGRGQAAPAVSAADEIAKLHGLLQAGAITEAEFGRAKTQLLGY